MSTTTSAATGSTFVSLARTVLGRMLVWLVFAVGIALLPIIADWLGRDSDEPARRILGNGELYLVTVGVAVAAAAELFSSSTQTVFQTDRARLIVMGLLFGGAILASIRYADNSSVSMYDRISDSTRTAIAQDFDNTPGSRAEIEVLFAARTQSELLDRMSSMRVAPAQVLSPTTTGAIKADIVQADNDIMRESAIILGSVVFIGLMAIMVSAL